MLGLIFESLTQLSVHPVVRHKAAVAWSLANASALQLLIVFSKTPQQTSPRRAFFDLPRCTTACPAACTSPDPSATIHVDWDVRGHLITLRLGPNSRVTNANMRCSYPADGQPTQLPRPINAAVACRTAGKPDQWQKRVPLYRPRVALSLTRSVEKVGWYTSLKVHIRFLDSSSLLTH